MNGLVFIMLLTISSIVTGLVTQVWKKLTNKFPIAVEALIAGLVIGGGTGFLYMYMNEISFNVNNIIYLVLLGIASAFGATIGFDKVTEAIKQINFALGKKDSSDAEYMNVLQQKQERINNGEYKDVDYTGKYDPVIGGGEDE